MGLVSSISENINNIIANLKREVPSLETDIEVTGQNVPVRIIYLQDGNHPTEHLVIIESPEGASIFFGHQLSIDFPATIEDATRIEQLLRKIVLEGFSETVWIRGGKVIRAKARIGGKDGCGVANIQGITGAWGGKAGQVKHEAWGK